MDFYTELHRLLRSADLEEKSEGVARLLRYCNTGKPEAPEGFVPERFEAPSYASICRIVDPRELPKRRNFATREGLALMVHAITHIEYSAIDLALDAVYRFPEMPVAYKRDWLEVADDEIRHFRMLHEILESLGYRYGDFPVHRGLFDAALHTAGDVLERMAVVPRHYEATGLDVNPQIARKLRPHGSIPEVARLLEALEIIYEEEIDHVRKGDRWFRILCEERGLEPAETFRQILERYELNKVRRPNLNVEARQAAGFGCVELRELGAEQCEEPAR
jgi:uncharacterized ferritin-like protein (DUF455 family)